MASGKEFGGKVSGKSELCRPKRGRADTARLALLGAEPFYAPQNAANLRPIWAVSVDPWWAPPQITPRSAKLIILVPPPTR